MNVKRHLACAAFVLAAFLALPAGAPAAEIAGSVVLSGKTVADAVISIEGLNLPAAPDGTIHVIDHRNLNFAPHVLVVRAGAAVRFENSDGMPCRIYSISPAGFFVLRRQDGNPTTVIFDRPGVVEVRCADHGGLYAYVVIKENPYFALTDANGRYAISNMPPGRYTLEAWYEGAVVKSKTIEVGAEKLTVDFQAARPQRKAQEGDSGGALRASPLSKLPQW